MVFLLCTYKFKVAFYHPNKLNLVFNTIFFLVIFFALISVLSDVNIKYTSALFG